MRAMKQQDDYEQMSVELSGCVWLLLDDGFTKDDIRCALEDVFSGYAPDVDSTKESE
jgi:hypothetical protein